MRFARTMAALVGLAMLAACARAPVPPPPTVLPVAPAPAPAPRPVPEPEPREWTAGTQRVPIMMYHDVVASEEVWFDLTTAEFQRHLAALAEADVTVVPLADVVEHLRHGAALPPRPMALCFDDGTIGLYDTVFPLLRERGWPATYFVHTGYVGRPSTSKDHMTWDQLRELEASGLIDVEPHTVNHPLDLRILDDETLRDELVKSKAAVEREMGHEARFFAFPSDPGDDRVATALEAAGFLAAFNEERGFAASPIDRFAIPRFAPKRFDEVLADLPAR